MLYNVLCVELDGRRGYHEDYRPEAEGGFTVSPFETFEQAKHELEKILLEDDCVDGVVANADTNRRLTCLHGSYLF